VIRQGLGCFFTSVIALIIKPRPVVAFGLDEVRHKIGYSTSMHERLQPPILDYKPADKRAPVGRYCYDSTLALPALPSELPQP